jgi:hypothetical protein
VEDSFFAMLKFASTAMAAVALYFPCTSTSAIGQDDPGQ